MSTSLWTLLLYITPLVAGFILVLFMVKPLFAPAARPAAPFTLDLTAEPTLQAYLEEICTRVGVALPVRVDLDCQVNASASFRHGIWSLGRRDLVLTIGLPLVRALTAQQLAGVIAHEFGHFAQRTSMAFSHIIRSVSHWFARVVFERDSWDVMLEEQARTSDWRIAAMLHVARGGVWVSRKILHGLMYAGHAISCLLLRQMEYDADYYDIRLGGSEAFAVTSRELRHLSVASNRAGQDLDTLWRDRRLVRDYPRLVTLRRAQLDPEFIRKFDEETSSQTGRWSDTHPTETNRVERARRAACPGVFQLQSPASSLFADFDTIETGASQHMYRHAIGNDLEKARLLSADEVATQLDAEGAAQAAWQRLSGGLVSLDPPLLLTLADLAPDRDDAPGRLAATREWLETNRPALKQAFEEDNTAYRTMVNATVAHHYIRAGIRVVPGDFGLSESTTLAAETALASALACRRKHEHLLGEMNQQTRDWLRAAVQAHGTAVPEIRQLAETFASLSPLFCRMPELLVRNQALASFSSNAASLKDTTGFQGTLRELRDAIKTETDAWTATAVGVAYPFPHAQGAITVSDFLRIAGQSLESFDRLPAYLGAASALYFRLLARITLLAEQASARPSEPAPAAISQPDTSGQ